MSPSFNAFFDEGMPCTTSSLTEVHRTQGYPRYPLNAGFTPASRHSLSASRSRSAVVTPASPRAAPSPGQTAELPGRGPRDAHPPIEPLAPPRRDAVQEGGRGARPGDPVQEKAPGPVRPGQPPRHHLADQVVRDQFTPLDDGG